MKSPHPVSSLLTLLLLVVAGGVVGTVVGLMVAWLFSDVSDYRAVLSMVIGGEENLGFLRITQAFSSMGSFLFPPLVLGIIEGERFAYLSERKRLPSVLWLLAIAAVWVSGPVIDFLGTLNSQISLPDSWGALESWMQEQEALMEQVTLLFLRDVTVQGLFANLFVIAVLPAIGEEFLFRGGLQTILLRLFKNPHVAIWVGAAIFSAIHFQFFGFLPRLFLGAVFGYLMWWSGNIWVPVLAHFVNNASIVVMTFVMQHGGQTLTGMDLSMDIPFYAYFVSFVVLAFVLHYFRHYAKRKPELAGSN